MAQPALRPRFLAPGDKLGKFDLIRQIAVGGMAELYLARTMGIEGFEKLVVVKRILPQYIANPSFVNMFLNEARLSATLHHPNIAQVYDIGVEDGDYFFSMEYIHGEDLGCLSVTATENGVPLSLDAALTLVAGLCAGLHYAHEKAGPDGQPLAVVHRDVSPGNVLVSYDGAVKLVDFGIARAGSAPSTTRGGLKGKIAYMSPEQCRGKAVIDRRSDVFSVGTILYELTTGQLPFSADNEYGVLEQIVNADVPRPSTLVPSYPAALEAIVMRALARDPDQRYATALELQGHIEDFAHENRLRVSPLVLVRLMSTLFPARLEEWDTARAKGGFFVEQHVVRTLIESGKAADEASSVGGATAKNLVAPDEETTAVTTTPGAPDASTFDEDTTGVETRPVSGSAVPSEIPTGKRPPETARASRPSLPRAPTPVPRASTQPPDLARQHFPRAPTPVPIPGMPGAVPIVGAGAGTLRSNPRADSAPIAAAPAIDVTERVRVPTPLPVREETSFVRPPRRSRLPVFLALTAAIGVIAAIAIVMSGGSSPTPPARDEATVPVADEGERALEPVGDRTEPEPIEQAADAPIGDPANPDALAPEGPAAVPVPASLTKIAKPDPRRARPIAKVKPAAKKPAAEPKKPAEPKPESKPKEPAWNDDSPFMPVRTDKR